MNVANEKSHKERKMKERTQFQLETDHQIPRFSVHLTFVYVCCLVSYMHNISIGGNSENSWR